MLDATELAKLIVGLLCPALPFLVKVGEKVAEGVSADAVKTLGKSTWDKARNIWTKLRPRVQQKGTAQQAVNKVLQRPDEISQFALISEVRDILEDNPELAQELLKLLQEKDSELDGTVDRSVNFQTGGVSIRGDFNNTGGTFVGGDSVQSR
jgi:hypothetical protein